MLLTKFNPKEKELFNPHTGFKGLDRIIENFLEDRGSLLTTDWNPSVSTREGANAYHIDIDLPGVNKEDVKVNVNNGYMTISGERKESEKYTDEKVLRVESSYGKFERRLALPDNVDVENIRADSKQGVIEIVLPKVDSASSESLNVKID